MDDGSIDERIRAIPDEVVPPAATMADRLRRQAADAARHLVQEAEDTLQQAARRATDTAEALLDEGRRQVSSGVGEINARIDANPVTAIIIAGVGGFVFGVLSSRRRH